MFHESDWWKQVDLNFNYLWKKMGAPLRPHKKDSLYIQASIPNFRSQTFQPIQWCGTRGKGGARIFWKPQHVMWNFMIFHTAKPPHPTHAKAKFLGSTTAIPHYTRIQLYPSSWCFPFEYYGWNFNRNVLWWEPNHTQNLSCTLFFLSTEWIAVICSN